MLTVDDFVIMWYTFKSIDIKSELRENKEKGSMNYAGDYKDRFAFDR